MRLRTIAPLAAGVLIFAVAAQAAVAKPFRNQRTWCSPSYTTAVKTCVTGPIEVTSGDSAGYSVELINKTDATLENVAISVEELGLTKPVKNIGAGRSATTSVNTTVPAQTGDFCLTFTPFVNGAAQPSSVRFCSTVT